MPVAQWYLYVVPVFCGAQTDKKGRRDTQFLGLSLSCGSMWANHA